MFASDSNRFPCNCVLLLRFNGKSYKLWLWLASKKGICQASSATHTHVQYFISQVVLAISLDNPCKAALPCSSASSSAIKGRRELWIPAVFGKVQLPSLLTTNEKGFTSSPNFLACLFVEASIQTVWVVLQTRLGPGMWAGPAQLHSRVFVAWRHLSVLLGT